MRILSRAVCFFIALSAVPQLVPALSPPLLPGQVSMQEEMLGELHFIDHVFRVMYAPSQWKQEQFGWNRSQERYRLENIIDNSTNLSTSEFRYHLRTFVRSTRDYHTNISFFSTELSFLPFTVRCAEGRVFISFVKGSAALPMEVGDELLTFEGLPAYEAILRLKESSMNGGAEATDLALASTMLTWRRGSSADFVPQGSVTLRLRSAATGAVTTISTPWTYRKEQILPIDKTGKLNSRAALTTLRSAILASSLFQKQSLVPLYAEYKVFSDLLSEENQGKKPFGLGTKSSFVPDLGEIIWRFDNGEFFDAYIYKTPYGRSVGYVRIPEYGLGGLFFQDNNRAVQDEFGLIVSILERYSDALVLDQLHNPGGYLFYCMELASMLTDKPLKMLPQKISITPCEISAVVELLNLLEFSEDLPDDLNLSEEEEVDPALLAQLKEYCQFILDQWQQGVVITEPFYVYGIKEVLPSNKAHYTKPILMLIDELGFSCGDVMPAWLKDNDRATLFGVRTAGAGGEVQAITFPNRSGIARLSFTASLLLRKDGQPIENLGVSPDISYSLTAKDLQGGYQQYAAAVNEAVEGLLAGR